MENFLEEHHILSPDIGVKKWFKKCWWIAIYFLSCVNLFIFVFPQTLRYTEWATHQKLCAPDVKNKKSLNPKLYFTAGIPKFL